MTTKKTTISRYNGSKSTIEKQLVSELYLWCMGNSLPRIRANTFRRRFDANTVHIYIFNRYRSKAAVKTIRTSMERS